MLTTEHQEIRTQAKVVDADGKVLGKTPLTLPVSDRARTYTLMRRGYKDASATLEAHIDGELRVKLRRKKPRPRDKGSEWPAELIP